GICLYTTLSSVGGKNFRLLINHPVIKNSIGHLLFISHQLHRKNCQFMRALKILLPIILVVLTAVSCVTGKRYNTLTDRNLMLMEERDSLKAENIWLTMSNRELTAKSRQLTEDTDRLTG